MRLITAACLAASLAMLLLSSSSYAQIKVEPDETDLPPPIVLQQKGVTAEEYSQALADNQYYISPENPDVAVYSPQMAAPGVKGVELTAEAHRTMMDAAIEAGKMSPVTTDQVRAHIQGDNDYIQGQDAFRAPGDNAPLVAPHPASAPPTIAPDIDPNARATGDLQKNFPTIANTGWTPPDTQLAVGGGYVVAATNSHYAIYDLDGVVQGAATNQFDTFFASVIPAGWDGILFDPKVVYNPWNGRFVMLVLGVDNTNQVSRYFIAYSKTSNPNNGWWLYAHNNNFFATDAWLDYSGLAVDQWGVYATGNMFFWANGYKYAMMAHYDLDGYSGGVQNGYVRWDLRWPDSGKAFTLQPATAHTVNIADGGTTYYVNTLAGSGNKVLLWKLSGHTGPDAPGGTVSRTEITVDQYYSLGNNVVQPGSTTNIDGGDARVMNAVYSQNNVYATLTNDTNNNADGAAAYTFRLGVDSNTKEWAHNLSSPGWYYTYPAVTIKGSGGDTTPVGVYMSITHDDANAASDIYASAGVKLYALPETDDSGRFSIFKLGLAPYVRVVQGRNRWGDYTGAAYDWACPGRMWGAAEFAGTGNTWATQAAAYMMDNSSTACAGIVPDQVETIAPNGGSTDTTPTFTWTKPPANTITGFRLIVSKDAVTQYDLTLTTADAACSGGSSCTYTPTNVLTPGAHTFTVSASNSIGSGPASNARSFSITLANDDFANAIAISDGSITGTLAGATLDGSTSGAGAAQPDVWYSYTAAGAGTLRINTCGSQALSGLDSVLSVHANTGVAGTAANQLALNDDWQGGGGDPGAACPGSRDSSLAMATAAGDALLIRVSKFSASSDGAFNLNVSFEPEIPGNDAYTGAPEIVPGVTQGTLFGASNDGSATAGLASTPDVWFTYTAPAAGTLRANTCGSMALGGVDTVVSVHPNDGNVGTSGNQLAVNDDWSSGDTSANCPGIRDSALAMSVNAGDALLIRVATYDVSPTGAFQLSLILEITPPPNDDFANQIQLTVDGQYPGTLTGATSDGSGSAGTPGQPDVWYTYFATATGIVRIDTCGSQALTGLDTVLTIHTNNGAIGTPANEIAFNNDTILCSPVNGDSGVEFAVTAGQGMLIRVTRSDATTDGDFVLNVSTTVAPPPNDDFVNQIQLTVDGQYPGTLTGATNDGSGSSGSPGQPDVWYTYFATATGTARIDTCGSQALTGLDTVLTIHTNNGAIGTPANEIAFNDDTIVCSPVNGDSGVEIAVTAGQGMLIRVTRSDATTNGDFVLNVSTTSAPPPNDDYFNALLITDGALLGTLYGATLDGSATVGVPGEPDVWFAYIAAAAGVLRVNTCGSNGLTGVDTVLSVHPNDGTVGTIANELAANDDWPGGDTSANCPSGLDSGLAMTVSAGDQLLIRVSRYDAFGDGDFFLNVVLEPDADTDGDGIGDSIDNCTIHVNPSQLDTDGDGYGNRCDGDFNNDCIVNPVDLGIFRTLFFTAGNVQADLNGDGVVNPTDLGLFRTLFFQVPGPSATDVCAPTR